MEQGVRTIEKYPVDAVIESCPHLSLEPGTPIWAQREQFDVIAEISGAT